MATFFTTDDEDMVRRMFEALDYVQPDLELRAEALRYWESRGVDLYEGKRITRSEIELRRRS